MTPDQTTQRSRNRRLLITILVLFVGSFIVAGVLRFSGWRPADLRNKGELLQPYGDLRAVQPRLMSGDAYPWMPEARLWRVAVAPPPACGQACVDLSRELDTVWRLFGHDADHVHLLWFGAPPAGAVKNESMRVLQDSPALRAGLPRLQDPAGIPVYVIDPNGFVILRYAPGFDPGDLRTDVARLLKLR